MGRNPDVKKRNCTSCGKSKRLEEFYKSESMVHRHYNRISICKDCVCELFNNLVIKTNSERLAMYRLCRKLDYPFIHSVFDMAEKEANRRQSETYGLYFQKINSLGPINGYCGDFDDSDDYEVSLDNAEDLETIKKQILKDFKITQEMVRFWGADLSTEDYMFLENEYKDWLTKAEVDSKSSEELIKHMCFTSLTINNKRKAKESVDKELKTYQDLMASCNLKPNQESAMSVAEKSTLGMLIKKWENEHPIPDPDPEWKDVNNITKYIKTWFTGHLSRMMGVDTGDSKEYWEEINRYTVGDDDG